jgi:hypothetical protein
MGLSGKAAQLVLDSKSARMAAPSLKLLIIFEFLRVMASTVDAEFAKELV